MKRRLIIVLGLINILISCKVTEPNLCGKYSMKHFPKTIFKINSDKTFEFTKNITNPYLLPFDHPNENFFITRGNWHFDTKDLISFTSFKDSVVYDSFRIISKNPKQLDRSVFTFFDTYGDTIPILYVQFSDSMTQSRMHGTMPSFYENLAQRDTFEFHFYGYKPWKFISNNKENRDFDVSLIPEYRPGYFSKADFKITRRKLFDLKYKVQFRKTKNGM